jgi:hypothetical protein
MTPLVVCKMIRMNQAKPDTVSKVFLDSGKNPHTNQPMRHSDPGGLNLRTLPCVWGRTWSLSFEVFCRIGAWFRIYLVETPTSDVGQQGVG